jgi:hypothetical protein
MNLGKLTGRLSKQFRHKTREFELDVGKGI